MDIKQFPYLDKAEFSEACHHLDRRYCQAKLGSLRRRWKLRLCTALDMTFSLDGGYTTYVQITRPLEADPSHDELSLGLDRFSISQEEDALAVEEQDMRDVEDADEAALQLQSASPAFANGYVVYEIHLHPTYRVPCLWFTLHDLPFDQVAFNIDTVFRLLVPNQYKQGLRSLGGIGGISADHHPVTGVPSFFVHPCLLGDALSNFECSKEDYLMVWLGLVGGCVGLWAPKEMAVQ
jgi:ubiquitin-like-conjugating enzyme ATG10